MKLIIFNTPSGGFVGVNPDQVAWIDTPSFGEPGELAVTHIYFAGDEGDWVEVVGDFKATVARLDGSREL